MSLTNGVSFELKPKMKPVTFDDYFIIMGNSELRIKFQDDKIFSNFGLNNGFFDNKG